MNIFSCSLNRKNLFQKIFVLIITSVCLAQTSLAQQLQEKIKISVMLTLSGASAPTGIVMKDAILFANKHFGGDRYELIFEDDRCEGKTAVSIAQKFISIDKVKYVLGFTCSSVTLATVPLFEKAKILMIVTSASSPKITGVSPYLFQVTPNDYEAGKVLGDFAGAHFKHVALISELTEYAKTLGDIFAEKVATQGIKVEREDFIPNTADFHSLITRLQQKNIDAIFINSEAEKTFAIILQQLRITMPKIQILGAYWPGSNALLEIAKDQLEGTIFVDTPSLDAILNENGKTIMKEYYAEGGNIGGTEAMFATSYEGFHALITAIESKEDPNTYLANSTFQGIFGEFGFDSQRKIEGLDLGLKKILNGQPVSY